MKKLKSVLIVSFCLAKTMVYAQIENHQNDNVSDEKRIICNDTVVFRVSHKKHFWGSRMHGKSIDGKYEIKGKMKRSIVNKNKINYKEKISQNSNTTYRFKLRSITGRQKLLEKRFSKCRNSDESQKVKIKYPKNNRIGVQKTIIFDSSGKKTCIKEKFKSESEF